METTLIQDLRLHRENLFIRSLDGKGKTLLKPQKTTNEMKSMHFTWNLQISDTTRAVIREQRPQTDCYVCLVNPHLLKVQRQTEGIKQKCFLLCPEQLKPHTFTSSLERCWVLLKDSSQQGVFFREPSFPSLFLEVKKAYLSKTSTKAIKLIGQATELNLKDVIILRAWFNPQLQSHRTRLLVMDHPFTFYS